MFVQASRVSDIQTDNNSNIVRHAFNGFLIVRKVEPKICTSKGFGLISTLLESTSSWPIFSVHSCAARPSHRAGEGHIPHTIFVGWKLVDWLVTSLLPLISKDDAFMVRQK